VGGVLAFLIQPLHWLELITLAKECIDGLLRKVAMAGAGVDDERAWCAYGARHRAVETLIK
jgi:hypothetical protein